MIRYALVVGLGLVMAQSSWGQDNRQQESPPHDPSKVPQVTAEKPMSFWMAKKLDYSKSLLESLTKADYDKLAADAEQLRLFGKMEGLIRRKNESYRLQLRSFDLAMVELIRQSKRHNPEGAALAFNQMTTSCVACHVLLREGVD